MSEDAQTPERDEAEATSAPETPAAETPAPFWPGYRWRTLAHKVSAVGKSRSGADDGQGWWRCRRCDWNGQEFAEHHRAHPECGAQMGIDLFHSSVIATHSEDFAEPVEFDELVIDHWAHLEQMNERDWWMRIGNVSLDIHINADGSTSVIVREEQYHEGDTVINDGI